MIVSEVIGGNIQINKLFFVASHHYVACMCIHTHAHTYAHTLIYTQNGRLQSNFTLNCSLLKTMIKNKLTSTKHVTVHNKQQQSPKVEKTKNMAVATLIVLLLLLVCGPNFYKNKNHAVNSTKLWLLQKQILT